jgi:hypothetical protein
MITENYKNEPKKAKKMYGAKNRAPRPYGAGRYGGSK